MIYDLYPLRTTEQWVYNDTKNASEIMEYENVPTRPGGLYMTILEIMVIFWVLSLQMEQIIDVKIFSEISLFHFF